MKRCILFSLIVTVLSGCFGPNSNEFPAVTADFRFSNSGGFGTQNGAFLHPGQMYVWDIANNDLELIETMQLIPSPQNGTNVQGSMSSTGVGGISITGIPASLSGSEGLISASIGAASVFRVDGAIRENYNGTITAMRKFVVGSIANGNNPDLVLHPRDDNYRIVLINSVLRAEDSSLSIGGSDATDPDKVVEVSLNSPIGEIAAVRVRAASNTDCGRKKGATDAEPPVCFFNVIVRDPHYEEGNVLMQFRNIPAPKENLPAAFRSLR